MVVRMNRDPLTSDDLTNATQFGTQTLSKTVA
jgi:hypothetical protein